jgi:transcriptional regulator with XRE-family HTH domain
MANKPIEITFVADVAAYLRDVKKLEVSTDDIAQALVGASNDGADLERKLGKAMKAATKDTNTLEAAIKDLPKATSKAAAEGVKDMRRLGDEAGDAGRDAGKNLGQNLGEGLSSGDVSDTLQDAFGEMLGNIEGPVSAALAAGAAIGLALYNGIRGEAEKQKEKLTEAFGFADLMTGEIDKLAKLKAGISELGGGDEAQGWKDASKYAALTGLSAGQIAAVVSGQINPETQKLLGYLEEESRTYDDLVEKRKLTRDERERREAVREILATTTLQVTATEQASAAAASATSALRENEALMSATARSAERVLAAAKELPENIRVNLEFYMTGPGAALVNPNSASYSPGHVSIANSYIARGKGS